MASSSSSKHVPLRLFSRATHFAFVLAERSTALTCKCAWDKHHIQETPRAWLPRRQLKRSRLCSGYYLQWHSTTSKDTFCPQRLATASGVHEGRMPLEAAVLRARRLGALTSSS